MLAGIDGTPAGNGQKQDNSMQNKLAQMWAVFTSEKPSWTARGNFGAAICPESSKGHACRTLGDRIQSKNYGQHVGV